MVFTGQKTQPTVDWTSNTECTGAIGWQSAAWYDQVAGCDGPKTATTTCWRSDNTGVHSSVRYAEHQNDKKVR